MAPKHTGPGLMSQRGTTDSAREWTPNSRRVEAWGPSRGGRQVLHFPSSGAARILHLGASPRIATTDGESLKSCSLSLGLSSPRSLCVDIDTRCGEDLHPPSHSHPSLPHLALLSVPAQRPLPGGHCLAGPGPWPLSPSPLHAQLPGKAGPTCFLGVKPQPSIGCPAVWA